MKEKRSAALREDLVNNADAISWPAQADKERRALQHFLRQRDWDVAVVQLLSVDEDAQCAERDVHFASELCIEIIHFAGQFEIK